MKFWIGLVGYIVVVLFLRSNKSARLLTFKDTKAFCSETAGLLNHLIIIISFKVQAHLLS